MWQVCMVALVYRQVCMVALAKVFAIQFQLHASVQPI